MSTLYTKHPKTVETTLLLARNKQVYSVDQINVSILYNKIDEPKALLKRILRFITIRYRYYKFIHTAKPNVSVSFMDWSNIDNMLACLFTGVKCVVSLRHSPFTKERIVKISLYLARYFSDMMIVNSEDIRNYLISKYHYSSDKVCCIYNPKDIEQIHKEMEELIDDFFFRTDELILLAAGRLVSVKGHIHLLRVFAELRKKYSCRLAICGVGPLESELKSLTENFHIQDSVAFLGFQSNVYKYMNAADIFVMSSLTEAQPNALIEALICGCPCVSVDCDYGPREILENGKYGLLSKKITKEVENPATDPLTDEEQDLYDKLELMLTNKELRDEFRRKSVEVYDKFDEKIIVKKYFDTFLEGVTGEK